MLSPLVTKTLKVNRAFLQEIKDSHPDLTHALSRVRHACQAHDSAAETTKELIQGLDDLRDCLALQFALEESYGYVEVSSRGIEADCDLAEQARSEHCVLYLEISSLCEQAQELQYRGFATEHVRELINTTERFLARLVDHERLEFDLIHQESRH